MLSPERNVPETVVKPPYYFEMNRPSSHSGKPEIKTIEQINKMRESCKLAANVLKKCDQIVAVRTFICQVHRTIPTISLPIGRHKNR
jgi:methionyl aminopeptidase